MNGTTNARWRRQALALYVITTILLVMALVFAFIFSVGIVGPTPFDWVVLVPLLAVLVSLFLTDFPIAETPAAPREALSRLGARLRFVHARVEETEGALRVRLNYAAVVRIRATLSGGRSLITFRADMTTSGWVILLLVLLTIPLVPILLALALFVFWKARSFALTTVAPLVSVAREPPGEPGEAYSLLVNGLAESHRMAAEAYEAEHDSYLDALGVVFVAALLVAVVVFVQVFLSSNADFSDRAWTALQVSSVLAIAFGVGVGILVYRRFRPRLQHYRDRAEILRATWAREVARAPTNGAGPSAFEVLAESSREIPGWLDAVRRRGITRDVGSFIFVVYGLFAVIWFPGAVLAALFAGQPLLAAVMLAIGIPLTFGAIRFYRREKQRIEANVAEEFRSWSTRYEELSSRMDGFLREL